MSLGLHKSRLTIRYLKGTRRTHVRKEKKENLSTPISRTIPWPGFLGRVAESLIVPLGRCTCCLDSADLATVLCYFLFQPNRAKPSFPCLQPPTSTTTTSRCPSSSSLLAFVLHPRCPADNVLLWSVPHCQPWRAQLASMPSSARCLAEPTQDPVAWCWSLCTATLLGASIPAVLDATALFWPRI